LKSLDEFETWVEKEIANGGGAIPIPAEDETKGDTPKGQGNYENGISATRCFDEGEMRGACIVD
jgi:hypothetical protein